MQAPASLAGDGVALRALRPADAPAYAAAFRDDPQLGTLIGIEHDPDEEAVLERIARAQDRAGFELAITAGASDAFCGVAIVHTVAPEHGRAEVGFWLAPHARGAALGLRAVRLLVDWLFGQAGLRRIEMTTTPDNRGALVLAERLGFTQEGVLRRRAIERGRPVDIVWFGLLREEWGD